MSIIPKIDEHHAQLTAWRRELHAHPQTAYEETFAAEFISARMRECGITPHEGLAGTGVVGTLTGLRGGGGKLSTIGLRADIDALDIEEANEVPYRSQNPGKMHACGHDGHTTMLLGAMQYLAATRDFAGTVHFIFQPAEENEGGARRMVQEGLFDRFPTEAVFGMHNWPGLDVGQFAVRSGPVMAAFDVFEITIEGRGTHAAMPHLGTDAVVAAAHVVTALQTIASRMVNALDRVVLTVTQVHAGDTWNVIPGKAVLRGTVRTFRSEVQDMVEPAMKRIIEGVCAALGTTGRLSYERRCTVTVNTQQETDWAAEAAVQVAGREQVDLDPQPCMGSEDFAEMLKERPGCYIWIGNGSAAGGRVLHNPRYDFNDEILPWGASYWARLVEHLLGG